MLRLLLARRVFMVATAGSVVVLPVVLAPPAAWAESPNPSACHGLYRGSPPGSLAITTSPSGGAVLRPGDEVEVTATWDTAEWPRPILHKVLDCLLVDGEVDYDHSTQEKPTENDGYYRYRFTVPNGARGKICDRVRLSGRLVEDGPLVVQKSNTICFSMAAGAGNTGGSGGSAGPGKPTTDITTQAVTPAEDGAAAPVQPLVPSAEAPVADSVVAAAPALELSAISLPMLPRTGADPFPLVRVGAMLVVLGGIAFAVRMGVPRPSAFS
jgi:hypothetical protein